MPLANTYVNFAESVLAGAVVPGSTAIVIRNSDAALFGTPTISAPLRMVLTSAIDPTIREIITAGTRTGNTFTNLTRGLESTAIGTFSPGDSIEARWTAGAVNQLLIDAALSSGFVNADNYAGADLGAKINAALASVSSGIIIAPTPGVISTAIVVGANKLLLFVSGTYTVSVSSGFAITVSGSNAGVLCFGAGVATLSNTTANIPTLVLGNTVNITDIVVSNLYLTRTVTATSGGDGLQQNPARITERVTIQGVTSKFNFIGFRLGATSYSYVRECLSISNRSHGVVITNANTGGGCQWYISEFLSNTNGGRGFDIFSQAGSGGMSLGDHYGIRTYANIGRGYSVVAATASDPINGVRLISPFIGEDNDTEIYLDTYGRLHKIDACFIEIAGTQTCGPPGFTQPPSNLGHGIQITLNNVETTITGGKVSGNSQSGVVIQGGYTTLTGTTSINNGLAPSGVLPINTSGVYINGAVMLGITGCMIRNLGTTEQLYGIYSETDVLYASGNNLFGNQLTDLAFSVPVVNSEIICNRIGTVSGVGKSHLTNNLLIRYGTDDNTHLVQVNGRVKILGSLSMPLNVLTTTQSITTGQHSLLVDATAGSIVLTLPLAAAYLSNFSDRLILKRIDNTANTVTIQGNGGQLVEGEATTTLVPFEGKTFLSNSVNAWWIV